LRQLLELTAMRMVHLILTRPDQPGPTEADANLVHDALWAHAVPGIGLEHLRVRAVPDGIDLVLFLQNNSVESGEELEQLFGSGFERSGALKPWRITATH
jgi:hypothetical protein